MNTLLSDRQVSLIHTLSLPDNSVPNHLAPTLVASPRYPSAPALPLSRSRLRPWHAGSSGIPGRIEFLIVRTGRSPPAAPHPASWRRSCTRFQAGERIPEEDLHLSACTCSHAHMPRPCAGESHPRSYKKAPNSPRCQALRRGISLSFSVLQLTGCCSSAKLHIPKSVLMPDHWSLYASKDRTSLDCRSPRFLS